MNVRGGIYAGTVVRAKRGEAGLFRRRKLKKASADPQLNKRDEEDCDFCGCYAEGQHCGERLDFRPYPCGRPRAELRRYARGARD